MGEAATRRVMPGGPDDVATDPRDAEVEAYWRRLADCRPTWDRALSAFDAGDEGRGRTLARELRDQAGKASARGFDLLAEELSAICASVQGALVLGRLEPRARRMVTAGFTRVFRYVADQRRGPRRRVRSESLRVWTMIRPGVADGLLAEEWGSDDDGPGLRLEALPERGLLAKLSHAPPDVCVVDVDEEGADAALDTLLGGVACPVVVLGRFDRPEDGARFVVQGASAVLAQPVSPSELRRVCLEAAPPSSPVDRIAGATNVGRLSLRLASEVQRQLSDAVDAEGRRIDFDLDGGSEELAILWDAMARIRDLVTAKSGGRVRFAADAAANALPQAGWMLRGHRQGAERRPPNQEARRLRGDLHGCVALVAEDDLSVNWFLAGVLRDAGAEVMSARTGREALDLAYRRAPDIVLADIIMPELDGLSLCRIFKRDPVLRAAPLLVLSWKDDMLQRMRELGAEADGFLRKQAEDAEVLQRVHELLAPRRALRERLERGGPVQGRLDRLTAIGLLRLLGQLKPDGRVSLRDAHHLYVVTLRGGHPVAATRTNGEGQTDRGSEVMAALLGVGAGRFAVEDLEPGDPTPAELSGSLDDQLVGPLCRVRAAQRCTSGSALVDVSRVALDATQLQLALEATPEPARSLLEAFAGGASPAALIAAGDVTTDLAERVLAYAARCGAVTAVFVAGEDVYPAALARQRAVAAGEGRTDVAPLAQPLAYAAFEAAEREGEDDASSESGSLDESGPVATTSSEPSRDRGADDDAQDASVPEPPDGRADEEPPDAPARETDVPEDSSPTDPDDDPPSDLGLVPEGDAEEDDAARRSRELAGPFGPTTPDEEGTGQTPVLASAVAVAAHARHHTPVLATVAEPAGEPALAQLAPAPGVEADAPAPSRSARRRRREEAVEEDEWTPSPTPRRRRPAGRRAAALWPHTRKPRRPRL
ncbi:MAG: response regulator [Myxococcota bacterium]